MGREPGPTLVEAGLCLFAASLPLSIAAANAGWVLAAAGLLLCARDGSAVAWSRWRGPLTAPLAVYLGAALLATAVAPYPWKALAQFHKDAHKLLLYSLLGVCFSLRAPGRTLTAFLTGAAAAALIGLGQSASGAFDPALPRAHAFMHPVTFGELMALAAVGAGAFLMAPGPRTPVRAVAGLAALLGAALVFSNTRGAIAGGAAGLFAMAATRPAWRRRLALASVGAGVLFVVYDLAWPTRSLIRAVLFGVPEAVNTPQSQLARLFLWKGAFLMAYDRPLLGVGVGGYRELLPRYVPLIFDGNETSMGNAHSLYIHHLAERGLVGAAALGWLLWTYAATAVRRAAASPDALRLWSLGAAAAFLVMNLTEAALQVEVVWMSAFLIWTAAESGPT